MTERPFPYIAATWLADALSGESQCEWRHWFRAHHYYDKRQEDTESQNRLAAWKSDHDRALRQRVQQLVGEGYSVRLEQQNKFFITGTHASVSGTADIVASREAQVPVPSRGIQLAGDLFADPGTVRVPTARIEDVKTGVPREKDFWQVVIYLLLLPMAHKQLQGRSLSGNVVYVKRGHEGERPVQLAPEQKQRVFARVREIAQPREPARVPSGKECRFCDIACCPDRAEDDTPTAETEEF